MGRDGSYARRGKFKVRSKNTVLKETIYFWRLEANDIMKSRKVIEEVRKRKTDALAIKSTTNY
ncbi:hypothetical protein H5410_062923 [Solanum commersonii]|uniref:Uncharacterized protein n=1 Tax=Solanum commersonii TaxID=4109 RepID=A0A9J5WCA6_SOLCO|nr:hypothetical protein H5410_062923 [Solanum commersonii]